MHSQSVKEDFLVCLSPLCNFSLFCDFVGTAGDSLSYHRGFAFSTKDRDNDNAQSTDCATRCKAGWWFNACLDSNLNGIYHHGKHSTAWEGVNWNKWKGNSYSAKRAEMKIKPE